MSEKIQIELGGRALSMESGAMAKQADGAVVLQYGETVVLAATNVAKKEIVGKDFFPLMVDYRERMYAGGRIPGGFFKREGRPRDKETLASRMTDRTLRPLFPEHMRREVQVDMSIYEHYQTPLSVDFYLAFEWQLYTGNDRASQTWLVSIRKPWF